MSNAGIPIFNFDQLLCPNQKCAALKDGVRIYRDDGHLTNEGSSYIGRLYSTSVSKRQF